MRSDRVVLEANTAYWNPARFPRLQRIIFDNTLSQQEALELLKTGEGRVDLVTEVRPLETLQVAESPFAKVVKNRGALTRVFGMFNMRKAGSPWRDVRLRQAVNVAINRDDLLRYATKGNGVIIPALVPVQGFGYDPTLAPYPFDPGKAHSLLQEAGYAAGLGVTLLASEDLQVQATVISKMLEQVGFTVDLQVLDAAAYNRKTFLSDLEQPPEQQTWDIALTARNEAANFPLLQTYTDYALGGAWNWGIADPELQRLQAQGLRTLDREQQQAVIRQMERQIHDQAYFLFLYNPIQLYAVNKAVEFVPYITTILDLAETGVTDEHWSVRKQKAAGQE